VDDPSFPRNPPRLCAKKCGTVILARPSTQSSSITNIKSRLQLQQKYEMHAIIYAVIGVFIILVLGPVSSPE
jgi:hypothetical protein